MIFINESKKLKLHSNFLIFINESKKLKFLFYIYLIKSLILSYQPLPSTSTSTFTTAKMAAVEVVNPKIELASEPVVSIDEHKNNMGNCSPRNLVCTKLTCQVCKANNGDPLPDGKVVKVLTCYYAGPNISSMNAMMSNIGYLVCENPECQSIIDMMIEKFSAACKALGFAGISRSR